MQTLNKPRFVEDLILLESGVALENGHLYLVDLFGHLFIIFEDEFETNVLASGLKNYSEAQSEFDRAVRIFGGN